MNSRGVIQDLAHTLNEGGVDVVDMTWNCEGLVTGAKVDDKGFTVEMSIPLAAVGGKAASGSQFFANIAREKYSLADSEQGDELQAWSATQGGFDDGKYFGRLVMTDGDAAATFFNQQSTPPGPALLKVDKDNPWTVAPGAIQAVPEGDCVRYVMKAPKVDEKGRVYAGFNLKFDPPIDVAQVAGVELAYTKPSRDVMLELLFNYTAADGKDYGNYWLPSQYGEGNAAPQLFVGRFDEANEEGKPAPVKLNSVTVYAVMEGGKTPAETEFAVRWVRVGKDLLLGK